MECKLCNQAIKNYNHEFNNLEIDDSNSVDICSDCVDKITKWQSRIYSKLFPTNTMKKIYGKK